MSANYVPEPERSLRAEIATLRASLAAKEAEVAGMLGVVEAAWGFVDARERRAVPRVGPVRSGEYAAYRALVVALLDDLPSRRPLSTLHPGEPDHERE